METGGRPILEVCSLGVTARGRVILRDVSFVVPKRHVVGIIGPSGVGKTTLLKSLNRLLDLHLEYRVEGEVRLDGRPIHSLNVDVDALRARVGMLFQQPVIFPRSIVQNVLFGVRHQRRISRREGMDLAEKALVESALWAEVKDRLNDSALRLSVGQQQRLCLARTLAMDPEIVLMDEPTSSLDPGSMKAIEERIGILKATRSIVLVTHNLGQAWRVTESIVRLALRDGVGRIAESGPTRALLPFKESAGAGAGEELS